MTVAPSPFPSQEEFAYWLSLLDPTSQFALSRSCSSCPLAEFLKSCGFSGPRVTGHGYWTTLDVLEGRPMPDWAIKFMQAIDAYDCGPINVTPALALEILALQMAGAAA